jgi:hypothetical protein
MKKEEFDSKMSSMLEKIGTDNSNLILDDVAVFLSDNQAMNEEIEKKNKEINDLKSRNETLQRVNGNLLQQVGTSIKEDDEKSTAYKKKDIAEEGKPIFNMRDAFDSNGNFKN